MPCPLYRWWLALTKLNNQMILSLPLTT
uniref:Uncharacterized protein n=1 Tax=Arundo donax TaxID=35708 RepID=A0A0A9F6U7_ARUDO